MSSVNIFMYVNNELTLCILFIASVSSELYEHSRFTLQAYLINYLWNLKKRNDVLASGSEGPGFESWLCQVDVESLGKALFMHLPHPTHV